MRAELHILTAGTHTTVQDLGRPGHHDAGVPRGGAIDPISLRIANLLVGNDENAAAIECALIGPTIRFGVRTEIALCGATSSAMPNAQRFVVKAKQEIRIGTLRQYSWAYLAVAGGIDVPTVLGSSATDTRVGWGGHNGRRLQSGDVLKLCSLSRSPATHGVQVNSASFLADSSPIRVIPAEQSERVESKWIDRSFRVSSRSDRMGMRLECDPIESVERAEGASSFAVPGTIQLPPDGRPIVMLADGPTLGGYPQIGHVISADLPRLAQRLAGSEIRFEIVTLAEAHQLVRRRDRELAFLRHGIESAAKHASHRHQL